MKELILSEVKLDGVYDIHAWATHLRVLTVVMRELRPLRILEVGTGNYSSSLFSAYLAGNPSASCKSVDNCPQWINGLKWLATPRHKFELVKEWNWAEINEGGKWDLIFIDQAPEESRIPSIEFFIDHTTVLCQHDAQYPQRYGKIWSTCKSVVRDNGHPMNTACLSKTIDVTEWWQ
jgi:hypothetical protein